VLARRFNFGRLARAGARMSTSFMRILVAAIAFALAGCGGDIGSDMSDVQEQQMQRSFYGTGNPAANNPPPDTAPKREPVPGEVVPGR
jgi:hypothetical protein